MCSWTAKGTQFKLPPTYTPQFQYFNHVSDCSVQCANGARNPETTVVPWKEDPNQSHSETWDSSNNVEQTQILPTHVVTDLRVFLLNLHTQLSTAHSYCVMQIMHKRVHMHTHTCTHTNTRTRIHACTHARTQTCTHYAKHTRTRTHTLHQTHTHIHAHTHTHTYMAVLDTNPSFCS